ncbi:hypothetical protein BU25DRAFT_155188 [Macroventuria anomochaeta]|uniref:Uncharacterized protein n=1 Tax=Macroventuria anomochaeta TaxID=301207 RepID=A0ACB6RRZ0_9PLEO|nr:uncharacterized protein BU25DRAFT_155188 [Macroventuria anomochaeta]KAF2624544.1 hypothetical protein BU25DRAFT_155188 [Macroventuria anomochaeta]
MALPMTIPGDPSDSRAHFRCQYYCNRCVQGSLVTAHELQASIAPLSIHFTRCHFQPLGECCSSAVCDALSWVSSRATGFGLINLLGILVVVLHIRLFSFMPSPLNSPVLSYLASGQLRRFLAWCSKCIERTHNLSAEQLRRKTKQ